MWYRESFIYDNRCIYNVQFIREKPVKNNPEKVMAVFEITEPLKAEDFSGGFQNAKIITERRGIELESSYAAFLLYRRLVGHKISESQKEIDVKFADKKLLHFLRNFDSDIGMYLEKSKSYYISKVKTEELDNNIAVHALFDDNSAEERKNVDLFVLFDRSEYAYSRRTFNFFRSRIAGPSELQVFASENLSSIIYTKDINQIFWSIGPFDAKIKKGEVYKLNDVGIHKNTVFIRYEDAKGSDYMYNIEGFSSSGKDEGRDAKSIYEYFERNIDMGSHFFVSAIDVMDSMLDYMIADPYGKKAPRIFNFSRDYESLKLRSDFPWNRIMRTDFAGHSVSYFPDRVP